MHARNETPCLDMALCFKVDLDSSRGFFHEGMVLICYLVHLQDVLVISSVLSRAQV